MANDVESLCQKSELAIADKQTSSFQKRLDRGLLGLTCNAQGTKQGCERLLLAGFS
jgi:hypothetical protein